MTTTTLQTVATYEPSDWLQLVRDFDLEQVFNELFVGSIDEFEDDPTAIGRPGGEIITELIEAVGEEFVLLPPDDSGAERPVYTVGKVDRNRSLVVDDDIVIEPTSSGGVIVKTEGDNRAITAPELRDVATAADIQPVEIR